MIITTVVERDNSGLEAIIEAAYKFGESRFMESLHICNFDKYKVMQATNLVRMYQARLNIESLALSKFSEIFIPSYATENNECFETAILLLRRLRTTITGTMKIFRKFCPVIRKQLPKDTVLNRSGLVSQYPQWDLFGIEQFSPEVQTLFHEMNTFFAHLVTSLCLCKDMIRKEKDVRGNFEELETIYEDSCSEVWEGLKDIVETFGVKLVSDEELENYNKTDHSSPNWKAAHYHKMDKKEMRRHVYCRFISEGQRDGLDKKASTLWPKEHDKAHLVVFSIYHFDSMGFKFRKNNKDKDNPGTYESEDLVKYIKWAGPSSEIAFYRYLKEHYKGNYKLPSWQAISKKMKWFDSMGASFDTKVMDSRVKELKEKVEKNSVLTNGLQPTG